MNAIYHYQFRVNGKFEPHTLRVKLLAQTATQYKVSYQGFHANGAAVGYETFVRKDRIVVDHAQAARELPHCGGPIKVKKPVKIPTWRPYKED